MKKAAHVMLIAATAIVMLPNMVSAQMRCPGGQAANGDCANEVLAMSAIRAAVIFSQPKISLTAYPVLPSVDRNHRYPHQLNPNQLPPTRIGTAPPPPPPPPPIITPPPGGGGGGGGGGPIGD